MSPWVLILIVWAGLDLFFLLVLILGCWWCDYGLPKLREHRRRQRLKMTTLDGWYERRSE